MSLPFAYSYPDSPQFGYWSPSTSTIDWCEENYTVSPYIAEFLNTISNAFFIGLAIFAMRSTVKNGLEFRFFLINFGFALVGIGSWLFHMTLKYEFQLLDELPMIYATCIPMWSVFSEGQSTMRSNSIGISLLFFAQVLTGIYLYFKDPTIHQVCYAILNVFLVAKSVHLTLTRVKEPHIRKQLFTIMAYGVFVFLSGFVVWNLDNLFCARWISLRRFVGMPYGFAIELHSWWHVLTGSGVYFYVIYLEYLRVCLIGKQNEYELVSVLGVFPELKLKKVEKSKQ